VLITGETVQNVRNLSPFGAWDCRMSAVMGVPVRADGRAELDRVTLERCRCGDRMALRVFVVRYERAVFALLSRMLGRSAEVEDLAQDTFLRAIGALPRFDPDGPARVSTWLLTIAMRLALDRMRKRVPTPSANLEWVAAEQGSPEGETSRAELRRAIALAVEGLPHDQRAAFVLAEFHDFSLAEIAEALRVPEATVKTRLFRAREKLGRALSDFGGERG